MSKSLNVRLKAAILERGRPDYEVAADLGISPSLLSHTITGRRKPTPELCYRIADLLGKDVVDLFPVEYMVEHKSEERIEE